MRDLGLDCFAICGIATEIGIEPTVRHAADLGYVPVIVEDACGDGDEEAGRRSPELLGFAGDAMFADAATFESHFGRARAPEPSRSGGRAAGGGAGWAAGPLRPPLSVEGETPAWLAPGRRAA
jgi:hypothetical protein